MTGYDALKSHPFFNGVNWEGVKNQTEPVLAYDVVYDAQDPTKVKSFSLVNNHLEIEGSTRETQVNHCNHMDVAEGPPDDALVVDLAATDQTLKSMKAF